MNAPGLVILGCGGHARSVADVAVGLGIERIVFLDDNACAGEEILGFPVLRRPTTDLLQEWLCFPASGLHSTRQKDFEQLKAGGHDIATVIAPTATISKTSVILEGTFVGHHAHVGPLARIGRGCIINSGAIVEHDCTVGEFCHISVRASLTGYATIGARGMLGASAVVIDRVNVGPDITVGAGAVVVRDLVEPGTYFGVPARRSI